MSETQWHTAIQPNVEVPRIDDVPPVELPASVERLGAAAARRMGWHGRLLGPMTLLGRKVMVLAELRADAHAERICLHAEPETDRMSVSTWVWPEFAESAPPPAMEIVGVFGVARHWRTALASAGVFAAYCDTGIVLPWSVAMTQDYLVQCLPRAQRYGVAVLTADPDGEVNLDQVGRQEPLLAKETAVGRWINELVYAEFLSTVDAAGAATGTDAADTAATRRSGAELSD